MKCDISVTSPRGHTRSRRARLTQASVIPANIGSPPARFLFIKKIFIWNFRCFYSSKKNSSEISDFFIPPKNIQQRSRFHSNIFFHSSEQKKFSQTGLPWGHPGVMVSHHWVIVGHPGVILGHPGVKLGHLGVILGSYWVTMGSYWVTLGSYWVTFGSYWVTLGLS